MKAISNFSDYQELTQLAENDPQSFWLEMSQKLSWFQAPKIAYQGDFHQANVRWFPDGQTNITLNCLDQQMQQNKDKVAIYFEPNDPKEEAVKLTYEELSQQVQECALALKSLGVKKGDVVCLYLSMRPELLISTLACARIGAIHSVVFAGFSAKALRERIEDCHAKIVITNKTGLRGNKNLNLLATVEEATDGLNFVEKTIIYHRPQDQVQLKDRQLDYNQWVAAFAGQQCPAEKMQGDDPLFILYTSGSTGRPKGLVHSTAGYMLWAKFSFESVFQMKSEKDLFWCTADMGWITGHTYFAYGPLLNGVSQVMFEGVPNYPDASRFWQIIEKYQVSHFYTAPTAIRALEAAGDDYVKPYEMNSLKVLGTVGEPINLEAWNWYHQKVGKSRCPIVDTWWQTETGGIMISTLAGITQPIACHATLPLPGIRPILLNEKAEVQEGANAQGHLCIAQPWPGLAMSIWGDQKRFHETYFSTYPGHYFTGDGAKRDQDGNYRITGRVDDVINVSGHRIGTAEVEDAINLHPQVVESAVVGYPHPIKGQAILAFVTTLNEKQELDQEINQYITQEIGPIAKTERIIFTAHLPKTRSGKIMRRILRKIAHNEVEQIGDTSTLVNPESVEQLINQFHN